MKYEKTDKIISEKYLSVEHSFDAERAWSQLEPRIKRKNRRGFWLWYVAGISLILFLSYNQLSIKDDIPDGQKSELLNNESSRLISESKDESATEIMRSNKDFVSKLSANNDLTVSRGIQEDDQHLDNNIDDKIRHSLNKSKMVSDINISGAEKVILIESDKQETIETTVIAIQSDNTAEYRSAYSYEFLSTILNKLEYDRDINILLNLAPMPAFVAQKNKSKIRLGVFGGYFIHSRSLEYSGDGSNENYISRVDEEEAVDAFDLGLKLDYFINDNFVVFGGVRYDQSYVERNADYIYLESITIPDHTVLIIETEDGTVEQTGDITYDGFYNHMANNYLIARRLGILAGVQYRIGEGRWKSFVNLGVEVPVMNSLSGIITNDGKPYNLSDGVLEFSSSSPLIFGGIGGEYAISETMALQFMIGGYTPLGNEYNESYNIIKKSTQLGLNLGIHFQL